MRYYIKNKKTGELKKFKNKGDFLGWVLKNATNEQMDRLNLLNVVDDPARTNVNTVMSLALPNDWFPVRDPYLGVK